MSKSLISITEDFQTSQNRLKEKEKRTLDLLSQYEIVNSQHNCELEKGYHLLEQKWIETLEKEETLQKKMKFLEEENQKSAIKITAYEIQIRESEGLFLESKKEKYEKDRLNYRIQILITELNKTENELNFLQKNYETLKDHLRKCQNLSGQTFASMESLSRAPITIYYSGTIVPSLAIANHIAPSKFNFLENYSLHASFPKMVLTEE